VAVNVISNRAIARPVHGGDMKAMLARLTLAFVLAALPIDASAQSRAGTIFGTVTDQSGGVLPGATVVVTEEDTSATRETVSDTQGRFEFALLPIGRYTVKVSLAGFSDSEVRDIRLETQQNREVAIKLGLNLPQKFGIPGANLGDPENSTLSQINPALGFTALGDRVFTPFTGGTKVLHFSDTLASTLGAHTLKTGGGIRLMKMDTLGAGAYAGAFSFDQFFTAQFGAGNALNAATGHPIASMLLGLPASGNRSQSFDGYTRPGRGANTACMSTIPGRSAAI